MHILRSADFPQKICQIVSLREPGKLRRVVQADVDHLFDASTYQPIKKLRRSGLGKADRG
jgi:hypothetical protein